MDTGKIAIERCKRLEKSLAAERQQRERAEDRLGHAIDAQKEYKRLWESAKASYDEEWDRRERAEADAAEQCQRAHEYREARNAWGRIIDAVEKYLVAEGEDEARIGGDTPLVDSVRGLVERLRVRAERTERAEREESHLRQRMDALAEQVQHAKDETKEAHRSERKAWGVARMNSDTIKRRTAMRDEARQQVAALRAAAKGWTEEISKQCLYMGDFTPAERAMHKAISNTAAAAVQHDAAVREEGRRAALEETVAAVEAIPDWDSSSGAMKGKALGTLDAIRARRNAADRVSPDDWTKTPPDAGEDGE